MISPPDWMWPNIRRGTIPPLPCDLPPLQNAFQRHLEFIENEVRAAAGRETERDQTVQSRLIALLGLSSTLASLTSALLGIAATTVNLQVTRIQMAELLTALSYIAIQFVAAMYYTACGLLPREIFDMNLEVLDPLPGESPTDFRTAILSTHRSQLRKTRWSTDRRMDHMACSLRAFRNAACATAALLAIGVLTILNRRLGFCVPVPW